MQSDPPRTAWSTTLPPMWPDGHTELTNWLLRQPPPQLRGYECVTPTVVSTNYMGSPGRRVLRLSRRVRRPGSQGRGQILCQDWVLQSWTAPATGRVYAAHRWIRQPLGQTAFPLSGDFCPHIWLQARPLGWHLMGLSIPHPNDWVFPTPADPQGCSADTISLASQLGMIPSPDMSICAPLADALLADGHEERAAWVCQWYEDITGRRLM